MKSACEHWLLLDSYDQNTQQHNLKEERCSLLTLSEALVHDCWAPEPEQSIMVVGACGRQGFSLYVWQEGRDPVPDTTFKDRPAVTAFFTLGPISPNEATSWG